MDTVSTDITIDKKLFDQTYPLLDKFKTLAPGTFKHSQNIVNMCETVAVELGLNVDVIKCAALYHDCGKMNNPLYFAENQDGTNIHDELDPAMSYQIITRHVGDSIIYLLSVPEIPHEVIEIISQHHGNTILQAFYNKDKNAQEDKYRYKCSKPVSAEALILMLCDSIEATARALYNNGQGTDDFILKSVEGTILKLMDDEQLDNMKIGVLNTTKKILIKELESIYHKRVQYEESPTIAELREEDKDK
jgi:putative nucleotidyltransferase with HDIG domain